MRHFLWTWFLLPIIHFLVVGFALQGLDWLAKRLQAAAEEIKRSNSMAMALPVGARMAECSFQVTRANGDMEKPVTHRTYRNPLLRWGWAITHAFTT